MLSMKTLQAAAFALSLAGAGMLSPAAFAGSQEKCRTEYRSHDSHRSAHTSHRRSGVSTSYGDSSFRISFSYGTPGHRGDRYGDGHRRHTRYAQHAPRYSHQTPCRTQPVRTYHNYTSGYWKSVWVPAVYETRYDRCGRPYRVCVQAGHYTRVWVSTCRDD